jgi:hypothetical protein
VRRLSELFDWSVFDMREQAMSIDDRSTGALAWRVFAWPILGAAAAAWAFSAVRPALALDAWFLDLVTVLCGAAGLLAGGMFAFRPVAVRPLRVPALAWSFSAIVCVALLAGIPARIEVLGAAVVLCVVGWRLRRNR